MCSLSICQMDPVPKLQTRWSPGTGLLALGPPPDPGAEPETIAGCQQCIFLKPGSLLASEELLPADDALSTSVFKTKPNKPPEQQRQQPGLCWEHGQRSGRLQKLLAMGKGPRVGQ